MMNPYAYYPQNAYQMYQQTQALTQQQTSPQIGSFVRVQSEQQAHNYPVAYGASITFIDENNPYCSENSCIYRLDKLLPL